MKWYWVDKALLFITDDEAEAYRVAGKKVILYTLPP